MKRKIFFMAFIAILIGTLTSCEKEEAARPVLYVVNSSTYDANVYCDNRLIAITPSYGNSGKIIMDNVSINFPVLVEVYLYDAKGNYVGDVSWNNYYFSWNASYKITITNSKATIAEIK